MQFDCAFMLAVISPVVARKAKVDRYAADGIQRIFGLEFMLGATAMTRSRSSSNNALNISGSGGSSLRKAWILPRLPYRGDKAVCGWQAERVQFHAKNPYRKFEQRAKSGTVSMR